MVSQATRGFSASGLVLLQFRPLLLPHLYNAFQCRSFRRHWAVPRTLASQNGMVPDLFLSRQISSALMCLNGGTPPNLARLRPARSSNFGWLRRESKEPQKCKEKKKQTGLACLQHIAIAANHCKLVQYLRAFCPSSSSTDLWQGDACTFAERRKCTYSFTCVVSEYQRVVAKGCLVELAVFCFSGLHSAQG